MIRRMGNKIGVFYSRGMSLNDICDMILEATLEEDLFRNATEVIGVVVCEEDIGFFADEFTDWISVDYKVENLPRCVTLKLMGYKVFIRKNDSNGYTSLKWDEYKAIWASKQPRDKKL